MYNNKNTKLPQENSKPKVQNNWGKEAVPIKRYIPPNMADDSIGRIFYFLKTFDQKHFW